MSEIERMGGSGLHRDDLEKLRSDVESYSYVPQKGEEQKKHKETKKDYDVNVDPGSFYPSNENAVFGGNNIVSHDINSKSLHNMGGLFPGILGSVLGAVGLGSLAPKGSNLDLSKVIYGSVQGIVNKINRVVSQYISSLRNIFPSFSLGGVQWRDDFVSWRNGFFKRGNREGGSGGQSNIAENEQSVCTDVNEVCEKSNQSILGELRKIQHVGKLFDDDVVETLTIQKRYYEQLGFQYVSLADVYALTRYESNMKHKTSNGKLKKSSTGAQGVMQLTGSPMRSFKTMIETGKRNKYSLSNREKKIFGVFELLSVGDTSFIDYIQQGDFRRKRSRERQRVFGDKKFNIVLGISYLRRCEARGVFSTVRRLLKNDSALQKLKENTKVKLRLRGIPVNENAMNVLVSELQRNNAMKQRFASFARYNGEGARSRKPLADQGRFIYALSVLYASEHVFNNVVHSIQGSNSA